MSPTDGDVLKQITALVEEEHRLRNSGKHDASRIKALEDELDQCWDLLRQRRARREFGQTDDIATAVAQNFRE